MDASEKLPIDTLVSKIFGFKGKQLFLMLNKQTIISLKLWGGLILPLGFCINSMLATVLFPEYFNYQKRYDDSDKVFAGMIIDIIKLDQFGDPLDENYEQTVDVMVYATWKGNVSSVERLKYGKNLFDSIFPLLGEGTSVLVFAREFTDTETGENFLYTSTSSGTEQEYHFGGRGVYILNQLVCPLIFSYPGVGEKRLGWGLSDDFSYNDTLGVLFTFRNGWYVSEKAGFIFVDQSSIQTGWIYQQDLGWIHINEENEGWIWVAKWNNWIYLSPENTDAYNLHYYSINSGNWESLSSFEYWGYVGFYF